MSAWHEAFVCAACASAGDETHRLPSPNRFFLVGHDAVTVWSSVHDAARPDSDARLRLEEAVGDLMMASSYKADLKTAPIIVTTHEQWMREMEQGVDLGVRVFNGERRRSLVFVDEHPKLVDMIERTPGDFEKFRDRVYRVRPGSPLVDALELLRERAEDAFKSPGATYSAFELVSCLEVADFYDAPPMAAYVDPGATPYIAKR